MYSRKNLSAVKSNFEIRFVTIFSCGDKSQPDKSQVTS